MNDLISKSALKQDLLKRSFYPVIVKHALEDAPTVDAVEVVRCKDCIGKATWYKNKAYGVDICGLSGLFVVEDADYCSYGERKDDETD